MRRKLTRESIETLLNVISDDWSYSKHGEKLYIVVDSPSVDKSDYKRLQRLIEGYRTNKLLLEIFDRKLSTGINKTERKNY